MTEGKRDGMPKTEGEGEDPHMYSVTSGMLDNIAGQQCSQNHEMALILGEYDILPEKISLKGCDGKLGSGANREESTPFGRKQTLPGEI